MSNPYFQKIKDFADRLSLDIVHEEPDEELIVVSNEEKGIYNMVLDCEYPILIMEQLIYPIAPGAGTLDHFKRLLQMNRSVIHGAFVLDEETTQVIFRDTLQIENLDYNEFEGSINALSLGLAEHSSEFLALNQK